MNITFYQVKNLPVAVIDNYYDDVAVRKVWQEIQFYSTNNYWLDPEHTGAAKQTTSDGSIVVLKKNKGLYLDDVYLNRNVSSILTENRKIFLPSVVDKLVDFNILFRYVKNCTSDCTLLSYYEDSDYYKPHIDDSTITVVSWFYNEPKRFQGGNLIFENDLDIECKFNRTVVFPSILFHSVAPVKIEDDYRNKNFGRYTITQLLSYKLY